MKRTKMRAGQGKALADWQKHEYRRVERDLSGAHAMLRALREALSQLGALATQKGNDG